MAKYDVVVVGGGPGGYPAAIRAAQNGAKVAIIEKDRFGGECTNYGCIPTKALLKAAKIIKEFRSYPFIKGEAEIDYKELNRWVSKVVNRSSRGVEYLLRGYGVDIFKGEGVVKDLKSLKVEGEEVNGDKVIYSLGSKPIDIPGFKVDGVKIHNNKTILKIVDLPSSILIIGGGYIGVEYATIFSRLGSKVYIVELMDRILPQMDVDISKLIHKKLVNMGVEIRTGLKALGYKEENGELKVSLSDGSTINVDIVLVSVGRKPNTEILKNSSIKLDDRGFIVTNDRMETSINDIYASGDVTGNPMLAHKAFIEGVVAGENSSGGELYKVSRFIPSVIFTDPEVISVGYTLDEARKAGYDAEEKIYPIGGIAKAYIEGEIDGFVKMVYDREGTILGIHAVGPNISELAGEATYLLETSATLEDVAMTIHPHPTISEAIKEATEYILGKPYHYLIKK